MQRWIARLLVLVMVVPALGPLAMAHAAKPMAPHCMRQAAMPAMHCHGMAMSAKPAPPETTFRAVSQCCLDHDCCCRVGVQQWAQPQTRLLAQQNLPGGKAPRAANALLAPSTLVDSDSARAPPRS